MSNEEYIKLHPEQFRDETDKWLFQEFGIIGGCCSAEKSHEYAIARMIAEKFEENRLKACDNQTKEEAESESDFVTPIIEKEHRQPTYSDAIEYGRKNMLDKVCEWLENHNDYQQVLDNRRGVRFDMTQCVFDLRKAMEE